jgi:GNAT superfamily N-acetyltransferase
MLRVAEAAYRRTKATIRSVDLKRWDEEVALAHYIYDTALGTLPLHVTVSEEEFSRLASSFRPFLDPDLALVVEVENEAVGFILTLPDINQALQKVNGRLFPLGWAKLWWHMCRLDVASCKVLAVLPEYRGRGLEALLMLETAKRCWEKGYQRMDFSVTGEENVMMNRIVKRLGARLYRHYRLYEKGL